ncbi:MAG: hypothetical protein EON90_07945 [Brevundimonas sp.]|nr:MAG: hypothetical protein EON90_07945 [Brevundimonas sp.]
MIASIISLAALLAGQPSGAVVQTDAGVAVFGKACLSSLPVERAALASLAQSEGWTPLRAATPQDQEWRDVYRSGAYVIHLDQHKATDEGAGERICVVALSTAPAGWKDQIGALQANGSPVGAPQPYDTAVYQLPPGLELTMWALPDGSRIHALREPDNALELSINYPTGR